MKVRAPNKKLTATQQGWFDDVMAVLSGGFAVGDQTAAPLTFTWNSDAPPRVKLPTNARPLSIYVLAAVKAGDASLTYSGPECAWSWDSGYVTLAAIRLDDHTDYTVSILVIQ